MNLVFLFSVLCTLLLRYECISCFQAVPEALKAKVSKKRPPAPAESESPEKKKKLKKASDKVIVKM